MYKGGGEAYKKQYLAIETFYPETVNQLNKNKGEKKKMKKLMRFFKEEDGATAVEYGIMVAAIAAVIITMVIAVGSKTNNAFTDVNTKMGQIGQ